MNRFCIPDCCIPPPAQTRPLRVGDVLQYQQNNNGPASCGGLTLVFSNGWSTNFVTRDQNNVLVNYDTQQGWHQRTFNLDAFAGLSITLEYAISENCGLQGNWDMQFADISVLGTDGANWPISSQAGAVAWPWYTGGVVNVTFTAGLPKANYYVDDHLGTAQMELSAGGMPTWQGQFTPFGREIVNGTVLFAGQADGSSNHYKFTGKERDTESGLDYFGARYYASSMGRWMSPDWADKPEAVPYSSLDNPQSLNLYNYVGNNPLNRTDPNGHECPPCEQFLDTYGVQAENAVSNAVTTYGPTVLSAIGTFATGLLANSNGGVATTSVPMGMSYVLSAKGQQEAADAKSPPNPNGSKGRSGPSGDCR